MAKSPWSHNYLLIEKIKDVLLELGKGFSFVGNQTIGLLFCKEKNRLSVEWSLKSSNSPIGVSSYELQNILPKDILDKLPTEEDLNLHIDIEY